jgi:hypothetical protein
MIWCVLLTSFLLQEPQTTAPTAAAPPVDAPGFEIVERQPMKDQNGSARRSGSRVARTSNNTKPIQIKNPKTKQGVPKFKKPKRR